MVYWPGEKQWFAGRVARVTAKTAKVCYDDGDKSMLKLGDQWKLQPHAEPAEVERGKVRWGGSADTWYAVEKRSGAWFFVEDGLRVAKSDLKTLVLLDAISEPALRADDATLPASGEIQLPPGISQNFVERDGDEEEQEEEEKIGEVTPRSKKIADSAARRTRKKTAYKREWKARPLQTCGVDGCEFQTNLTHHLKKHQTRVHGIGDVDVKELNRKQREYQARQPLQTCGVDGCEFQTKIKGNLRRHQALVHGIGDVEKAEELRRKMREYAARQPAQRCDVDGCEFQTNRRDNFERHQACVHGIGDVEELRRKEREWKARPLQTCGVDGCEFQTNGTHHLKKHQTRVHGIGDVDVKELNRKAREYHARQPLQTCGVDGCEFQTKQKGNLRRHQALVHGIGDVDAEEQRRKKREYLARQPAQRCGFDGCEFQAKQKRDLTSHQARVHGIGDVEAVEERRRKEKERRARADRAVRVALSMQ
jgi:hypothetical protein